HASISSRHCELVLSTDGLLVRDNGSTNGTFVDLKPVIESWVFAGQTIDLGGVSMLVENTDITIAIPKFQQAPILQHKFPQAGVGSPVVMPAGALVCPRHLESLATYKCTQCSELMCSQCLHVIKRLGGQPLSLCPVCSGKCLRIIAEPQKKKTFLDTLRKTVKMSLVTLSGKPAPRIKK
ncbi:MAG: FHA domain-containing protein, partial [Verrucomicrobiota bacterium]